MYFYCYMYCVLQAQPTQKTKIAGVLMEVVVNTTTTFMVTGLMALAMDRQWPVVDAAKVTRESTARWPYVGQVVPTVAAVSIRMFVHVLMDIREPDVKQVYLQYLLAEI